MRTQKLTKAGALRKLRQLLRQAKEYGARSDAIVRKWGSVPKRWPEEIQQENADVRMAAIYLRDDAIELQNRYNVGQKENWQLWEESI